MLNIPETVKALYKADGVRKNFRVHFPNGELSDLTNADVVEESVRFTESLCSQDVLKFGLNEASVIEFETVGVANMYGMTIECGSEIDLSSLSAADLATIAAGSWDGTYVAAGDSDLGYAYFRVPYGIFRVESCPRDHQAMAHRKVTAYEYTTARISKNSPFELAKLRLVSTNAGTYTPDLKKLIAAGLGWYNPDALSGYTKTDITPWTVWPPSPSIGSTIIWGNNPHITVYVKVSNVKLKQIVFSDEAGADYPIDQLYGLDFNGGSVIAEAMADLETFFDTYSVPASARQLVRDYVRPNIMYSNQQPTAQMQLVSPRIGFSTELPVFYPKGADGKRVTLNIISDITITYKNSRGTYSIDLHLLDDMPSLYKYTNEETPIPATISSTSETAGRTMQIIIQQSDVDVYDVQIFAVLKATLYTFTDAYSFTDLLNGMAELYAQFGRVNRDGAFELIRLSNASPVSVLPGEYSGFWWDEYDVLPIGSVQYSFTDTENNENIVVYQFGPGESTYDMTGNEAIRVMSGANEDAINALLDESFIPYLGPVTFTPIDLSMKGLPFLEAGDYIAVTAEDGTTAYSFNMRQELDGIQVLTAAVESTSGEILEAEA